MFNMHPNAASTDLLTLCCLYSFYVTVYGMLRILIINSSCPFFVLWTHKYCINWTLKLEPFTFEISI